MGTRTSAKFAMVFVKAISLVSRQKLFHIQYVNIARSLLRLYLFILIANTMGDQYVHIII
uniref:Uncharacterized protein n=1 Tax=Picea sitchensis TaxID=3332 RepID=A9NKF9_PICSI|nr:unknown [Picea sitchensis]